MIECSYCRYIYNPTPEPMRFTIHYDNEATGEQERRAAAVIAHLEQLKPEELVQESHHFYMWIVLYHISWINILYAETLLDYFHSKDLIMCKQQVNNEIKQRKKRYLQVFTLGDLVFSQTYNSIRELKADTGRKPSQIKPALTQHLLCSRINQS